MTLHKKIIKKIASLIAVYGVQIWIILFVANVAVITYIRARAQSQPCMTQEQINSDSKCLYILNGNIYEQGRRSKPHKGHPCGMDVTSIIPSNHKSNASKYLSPNLRGSLCSGNQPTPTPTQAPTQQPTQAPTQQPTQRPTPTPTRTATQQPTQAPTQAPTAMPTKTPSPNPAATKTPTPLPTKTPTTRPNIGANITPTPLAAQTPSISPSPVPSETPNDSGFLRLMAYITAGKPINPTPEPEPTSEKQETAVSNTDTTNEDADFEYYLIYWSTIFSYVSFLVLLITAGIWIFQRIKDRLKASQADIGKPTAPQA